MNARNACPQCTGLEQAHDERMERYISLVELQTRMFRKGYVRAGKDLDGQIRHARAARDSALDDLLNHSTKCLATIAPGDLVALSK